ncbi:MAG: dephospho-CoA kinase [Actinobacteria bacterium]|nr:dephospho-CoA kinase [Actinomycetota bacterium]
MVPNNRRWVLCGGLASGKSAVRRMLDEVEAVFTIDADTVGREILKPEGPAFGDVAAAWPQVVSEGRIQRAALAAIVFSREAELKRLESITHPHIFGTISRRVERFEGVVVVEAPVLDHRFGDRWGRIVVDSSDEVRLERAVARGMTEQDARARISAQPSREEWLARADVVVPNHGSLEDLEDAVSRLVPVL